jgi:hypothetical protein
VKLISKEQQEQKDESLDVRRTRIIKVRILGVGLVLILISVLMEDFFVKMRYPPELKLPLNLRPEWTFDESRVKTLQFVGDIGIVLGWIILGIGIVLVLYGFVNRLLDKHLETPRQFEQSIVESIKLNMQTDRNFMILFLASIFFALMWFFNLLTYPPIGPLYFLREPYLQDYFPEVSLSNLPSLSTYGGFAVIQDTAILAMLIYVIYVRLRPGMQFGETFVRFALDRTFFLILLLSVMIFHGIGHLPFELYGQGQWGTGFTDIGAWIAFDKIAHGLTSAAITMLLVYIVTDQFSKYGAEGTSPTLFALVVAIALMISLGLAWEIFEWITNAVLDLGHFIDEILDAPKDLVWDAIGAVIGAILALIDLQFDRKRNVSTEAT